MRKTWLCVLTIPLLLLTACQSGESSEATAEETARQIRTEYLAAQSCGGTVELTADYGMRVYEFTMDFTWQKEGESVLTLTAPEEVAGLTARLEAGGSYLEYDGLRLGTGDLTGEGLTPMELVPTVMEYSLEGYMAECVFEDWGETPALRVLYRDPEGAAGQGVECTQWFAADTHALLAAELSYDGTLVLSSTFTTFYIGDDSTDGSEQDTDLGGDQPGESGA